MRLWLTRDRWGYCFWKRLPTFDNVWTDSQGFRYESHLLLDNFEKKLFERVFQLKLKIGEIREIQSITIKLKGVKDAKRKRKTT